MIMIASEANPELYERNSFTTLAMHKNTHTQSQSQTQSQTHAIHLIGLCSVRMSTVSCLARKTDALSMLWCLDDNENDASCE